MVHSAAHGMKRLPAIFYRTETGSEPVREWLLSKKLSDDDRKRIGRDIAKVEFGWPIGMPTCDQLGDGLLEIRTDLDGNRITRVIFCIVDGRMLLLHAFIKKAPHGFKAPRHELETAQSRRKDEGIAMNDNKTRTDISPFGSSFESFLVEKGIQDEVVEYAVKAVFCWQLDETRKKKNMTKKDFADLLGTSRSQLDRVLDPENEGVTIETLKRAAKVLGKKVVIELVDENSTQLEHA